MITLKEGGFELDILPELGGSVARFVCEGRNILRPAPHGVANVLETSAFPLVPFANRIENGLMHFEGKEYRLPLNFGSHPHALHGHGWQTAWRVDSVSRDRATLAFEHAPDEWPWSYAAEQVFSLGKDGLKVRLSVRSRDAKAMPVSLGLHPYIPKLAGTRVRTAVEGMWEADSTMMPTKHIKGSPLVDLAKGVLVAKAPFVDNTFTGWSAPARIEQPDLGLTVTLEASPECRFFHMFIPVGENYFCTEPVTAMPNAVNRPEAASVTGARVLSPGAGFAIEMRLGVRKQ